MRLTHVLLGAALFGLAATASAGAVDRSTSHADHPESYLVRRIGVDSLYPATFAVANCPELAIDEPYFRKVEATYHLRPDDLTPTGEFAGEIAALSEILRKSLLDDRPSFCSSVALDMSVIKGVLKPR